MKAIRKAIQQFIGELEKDHRLFRYLYNLKHASFNPKKDPLFYAGPFWDHEEVVNMMEAILAGRWLSSGEFVHRFEQEFSKKFEVSHSVMVNSGSSANLVMVAALKELNQWRNGDEVIISPVGFPTTLAPVVQNGLRPVFVDISFPDLNLDLDQVRESITTKTKAIFVSPVLGNPPDMDRLSQMAEQHGVQLVLDNCDSLGSKWKGSFLTKYAVASSCSFYPSHHITTGEGGMVSSSEPRVVEIARSLAWWGRDCYCVGAANLLPKGTCGRRFDRWLEGYDGDIDHKYVYNRIGYNLKPLDLQGAIGLAQLGKFERIHELRQLHKARIQKCFEESIPSVKIPVEHPAAEPSWFGVPVVCANREQMRELVGYLEMNRIQTRNYFAGNMLIHPGYRHLGEARLYPNANQVLDRVFFVGCSPTYSVGMLEYLEEVIRAFPGAVEHEKDDEASIL